MRVQIPTRSMQGEITEVRGRTLMWESDGKSGPIPYDQSTRLTVYASGDPGFVVPGAVVSVSGTLRPDQSVIGASLTVHVNPAQTAAMPGIARVNSSDPQINVKGRLVSLDPLAIKTIDGISMSTGQQQNQAGAVVPPIYDTVLKVKLRDPKPASVSLVLGSAPQLIAAGDRVTVTVAQNRPNVASAISVRKSDVLKSGRTKPEKPAAEGTKKEDAAKPAAEAKPDAAKPEAATTEEGKPAAESKE